jgi:spore cortex formation protein SpoVR/YcgB (stage V sporulation)
MYVEISRENFFHTVPSHNHKNRTQPSKKKKEKRKKERKNRSKPGYNKLLFVELHLDGRQQKQRSFLQYNLVCFGNCI